MKILFISMLMIQTLTSMTLAQKSLNSREAEEQARILVGNSFSKCGDSYFTGYINSISTSPGLILEIKGLEYSTQQITPTASDKLNGISARAAIVITFSSVRASKQSQPVWSRWGGSLDGYLSSPIRVSLKKTQGHWTADPIANLQKISCSDGSQPSQYWNKSKQKSLSAADEEMFRNIGSAGFTISSSPRPDVELVRYLYNHRSSDVKSVTFAPNGGWVALSSNGHPTYSNIPKNVASVLDAKQNSNIGLVAFGPEGSNMFLLTEYNTGNDETTWTATGIPQSLSNKLEELQATRPISNYAGGRAKVHFRQINLLSETEWLVVRSYYVKGKDDVGYDCFCSSELQRNIDLAWKDGFAGVFFSGAEKYIVVQGRNGFTVSNIPEDLENELNRRNRENMQIGGIFLAPNGSWVMRGFSEKKLDKIVLLE